MHNETGRQSLKFDSNVRPVIYLTGSRILSLSNIPKEQQYSMKLKGLSICFNMLKAALCGNYVNFGVIRLYGDRALDDSLEIFVKTLMSIQQSEVLVSGLILGSGDLKSSHINLSPLFCNMVFRVLDCILLTVMVISYANCKLHSYVGAPYFCNMVLTDWL